MSQCPHEWSDDYVCSKCGGIKYASAPMWAATTRMSSGPRGVWLATWSCADRDTIAPDPVYPGNALLAERAGGVTPRSVQRHLDWLALQGWLRIVERGGRRYIYLAWAKPREDWATAAKAEVEAARAKAVAVGDDIVAPPDESDTAAILTEDATILADNATGLSPTRDDIVAHTLDDLGSTLDEHLGRRADARDGDAPNEVPTDHDDRPPPSPPPHPSRSQPRQPRKHKREPEAQAGFDLGEGRPEDPVSVAVLALLADHRRLRREAQSANGLRETDLPAETSGAGVSLRKRLRRAVEIHGEDACRRALVFRAAEWRDDPGALERWSTDSMWSPKSLAVSIPAGTRASPGSNREQHGSGMQGDARMADGGWEKVSF